MLIGEGSKEVFTWKLVMTICEPKPITLSRICCWNPVTMATEMIITDSPNATLITPSRTIGLEKLALLFEMIRSAINSSTFTGKYD